MPRRRVLVGAAAIGLVVVAVVAVWAATLGDAEPASRIRQATPAQLAAAGLGDLPLAPPDRRVDLERPTFSNPTRITNPLFPISRLRSAVLTGRVDGRGFKTETTLLPTTRVVEWPAGRFVEAAISQYVAYLDNRIEEVALDYYAQSDDGAVWYLGEDVFNYEDGRIADTEGTWLAGREGPGAMIMPAQPRVGDVYRSENAPGLVFEEVTITAVGKTVDGPSGRVAGAIVARELHQDGAVEDKTFAPGYGEFFTGGGGDVEAMALAVPTDAVKGPVPQELAVIRSAAYVASEASDTHASSDAARRVEAAWPALRSTSLPPRLRGRLARAVDDFEDSARTRSARGRAAYALADATLDVELRYRPPPEIDRARFGLWARRLARDSESGDRSGARGDLATLEWIRDRIAHTLGSVGRTRVDAALVELRSLLNDDDLDGAAREAAHVPALVASAESRRTR
jgi:hypothetical protein